MLLDLKATVRARLVVESRCWESCKDLSNTGGCSSRGVLRAMAAPEDVGGERRKVVSSGCLCLRSSGGGEAEIQRHGQPRCGTHRHTGHESVATSVFADARRASLFGLCALPAFLQCQAMAGLQPCGNGRSPKAPIRAQRSRLRVVSSTAASKASTMRCSSVSRTISGGPSTTTSRTSPVPPG